MTTILGSLGWSLCTGRTVVRYIITGWPVQGRLGVAGLLQLHHLRGGRHVRHLARPVLEVRQVLQTWKRLQVTPILISTWTKQILIQVTIVLCDR